MRIRTRLLGTFFLCLLAFKGAQAEDVVTWEARRAAAMAAGIAAGEAAYAPFAQPIADAWENPAQVGALTAIAYRLTINAATYATCMALATNPASCLLWQIPGVAK